MSGFKDLLKRKQRGISDFNIKEHEIKRLIPFGTEPVDDPVAKQEYIDKDVDEKQVDDDLLKLEKGLLPLRPDIPSNMKRRQVFVPTMTIEQVKQHAPYLFDEFDVVSDEGYPISIFPYIENAPKEYLNIKMSHNKEIVRTNADLSPQQYAMKFFSKFNRDSFVEGYVSFTVPAEVFKVILEADFKYFDKHIVEGEIVTLNRSVFPGVSSSKQLIKIPVVVLVICMFGSSIQPKVCYCVISCEDSFAEEKEVDQKQEDDIPTKDVFEMVNLDKCSHFLYHFKDAIGTSRHRNHFLDLLLVNETVRNTFVVNKGVSINGKPLHSKQSELNENAILAKFTNLGLLSVHISCATPNKSSQELRPDTDAIDSILALVDITKVINESELIHSLHRALQLGVHHFSPSDNLAIAISEIFSSDNLLDLILKEPYLSSVASGYPDLYTKVLSKIDDSEKEIEKNPVINLKDEQEMKSEQNDVDDDDDDKQDNIVQEEM